jgi:signal transduction histidine kinase
VPAHDVVLVLVLLPLVVAEGIVRNDVAHRPVAIGCALAVVLLLLLRRSRPFAAFCAAFGLTLVVNVAAFARGEPFEGLYSAIAILLLPYSLFRFGAGRQALLGLGVLVLVYLSSLLTGEMSEAGDAIGAAVVLLLPAAVGASLRFRAQAQEREVETARALERERLARDLHDTVAHHVTAIVLQAQAGQVVASTKPAAAARAFVAIESEAAAALAELRGLVGVLRRPGEAPLVPQQGLDDLDRLARTLDDGRVVVVTRSGDLAGVSARVQSAVFRIAQESVTNALRHAKGATRVVVQVEGAADGVRVRVDDDGAPVSSFAAGFGLTGMAERARLLGGTFAAGPGATGFHAEAFVPREVS